jgi:hypothetical protein
VAFCQPQSVIIPQVADGGGWQTTLVLTSTTTGGGSATLSFYQETSGGATQSWNLSFLESTSQNVQVAGGDTVFLHTPGTGATTSVGWGQMIVSPGIMAYAIFTQRIPGQADQDGTASGESAMERFLVPFDNTSGFVTGVAIANPTAGSITISVNVITETGAVSQASISLPPQGHAAFALSDRVPTTAGHRGLAEFYIPGAGTRSATGTLSMLALRFNPTGAFTTAPVYAQTGSPIVGVKPPVGTR